MTKVMTKLILSSLFIVFAISPVFSQIDATVNDRAHKKDKFEALRNAYFTEKLEMTPQEASGFSVLHSLHEEAMAKLRNEISELRKPIKSSDTLSDKEYLKMVNQMADLQKQEIDLNKLFIIDCFDILDAKRAMMIPRLNKGFRKQMLDRRKAAAKNR